MDFAPTADTIGKDYAVDGRSRRCGRSRWRCARPGASRCACCPTPRRRCGRRSSGSSFSIHGTAGALRAVGRGGSRRMAAGSSAGRCDGEPAADPAALAVRGRAGGLKPVLEDRADREDRARPQVRRDRARAARRGAARARDRHDARELPARRDALVASARGARARAHRLQGADAKRTSAAAARRRSRSRRFPIEAALDYAGERADLALQLAGRSATCSRNEDLETLYGSSSSRSSPCSWRSSARASASTAPALAAQAQRVDQELDAPGRGSIYELSGEEFNINSPKKLSEILFDKLGLPDGDAEADDEDQGALDGVRGARGARPSRTSCRGSSSSGAACRS